MQVSVRLHATLKKYQPAGTTGADISLAMADGATVTDVLNRLGIPLTYAKMIVSGDERLALSSVLRDGQSVDLYPPLAGGA